MWSRLKTLDLWLIIIPILLGVAGIAVIYSITLHGEGGGLAIRQGWFLLGGLLLYIFFTLADYRSIRAWSWIIYGFTLLLLLAVRLGGETVFGARRWIDIGFTQLQPSEFAKLAVIAVVARVLGAWVGRPRTRDLIAAGFLVLIPVVLILDQPDLGSAVAVAAAGFGTMLVAGLSRRQWAAVIAGVLLLAAVGWASWQRVGPFEGLLKEYQRQRIHTFLDPAEDSGGAGYNVLQALIAIGSGGVMGRGLGYGSQSQLNFLPVAHTDFLFSALAESWGFVGSAAVLLLYYILIMRLIHAARIAHDGFSRLFCIGVASLFFIQVVVNIGMNLSLLPVTGITLPLMSAGGSSLLTMMALLGMVQSVVIREKRIHFD